MKVSFLEKKDLKIIKPLLRQSPNRIYWPYSLKEKEKAAQMFYTELKELLKPKGNFIITVKNNGKISGLISSVDLSWDSRIFGIRMAKIEHIITGTTSYLETAQIKNFLLKKILAIYRRRGIKHVSCRLNTMDISSIHCLEKNGFFLMDSLVTYILKQAALLPQLDLKCKIRKAVDKDLPWVLALTKENFVLSGNRFYKDVNIPKYRADQMYMQWAKNCFKDSNCEIFVAIRAGEVVGFSTMKKMDIFNMMGINYFGHGLIVVSPRGSGAALGLIRATSLSLEKKKVKFAEIDTQISNFKLIKILEQLKLEPVKTVHTFHKWNT